MGHWGYEPKENDHTADMLDDFDEYSRGQLEKLFRKRFRRSDPHEQYSRIGVLQKLLQRRVMVPRSVVEKSVQWLGELVADPDWHEGWRDPAEAKRVARKLKLSLNRLLDKHPGEHVWAPEGWFQTKKPPRRSDAARRRAGARRRRAPRRRT